MHLKINIWVKERVNRRVRVRLSTSNPSFAVMIRGNNGIVMRNLVIYASERADGGYESYHEGEGESLRLSTYSSRRSGNWESRPVFDKSNILKPKAVLHINIPAKKRNNHA